tara:strand:- start:464 stop:736 length:273 start_codon:yes stop_codon:yes gene_type:complete
MNRATLGLLILFQIAWTWTLSLYIRLGWVSPLIYLPQMLRDIEYLGAWAFILDFIVFTALYFVIKPHLWRNSDAMEDASEDEPLDNKTDN